MAKMAAVGSALVNIVTLWLAGHAHKLRVSSLYMIRDTPVRADISAMESFWLAVIETSVWRLGVE